jgi:AcrR family transcriptional regulator
MVENDNINDKQKKILTSALQMFTELGFHGAATGKIAANAGVSNGTLFHYYKTKDDLIVALCINIKEDILKFLQENIKKDADEKETFELMYIQMINWALNNKTKYYYVQQVYSSPFKSLIQTEVEKKYTKIFIDMIEQTIRSKVIKQLPSEMIFILINSQISGMFQYLQTVSEELHESLIKQSFEMMWKMFTDK